MKKKIKKSAPTKNKSAAITHTEAHLWQDLTQRTAEKYNRVQNGKGSAPRNCFSKAYLDNFDDINWNRNND